MYGSFKIIATHDNAYKLQLPLGFDAHSTFNVELLRKDPNCYGCALRVMVYGTACYGLCIEFSFIC